MLVPVVLAFGLGAAAPSIRQLTSAGRFVDPDRVARGLDAVTAGSSTTVRRRLEALADSTGADELLTTGSTYDRAALATSDASLAALLA